MKPPFFFSFLSFWFLSLQFLSCYVPSQPDCSLLHFVLISHTIFVSAPGNRDPSHSYPLLAVICHWCMSLFETKQMCGQLSISLCGSDDKGMEEYVNCREFKSTWGLTFCTIFMFLFLIKKSNCFICILTYILLLFLLISVKDITVLNWITRLVQLCLLGGALYLF